MKNKPVAWINRKGKDGEHGYLEWDKDDEAEINTPLYTHPVKYCPSEDNAAYEKGFIDGMAKQRDSRMQQDAIEGLKTFYEGRIEAGKKREETMMKAIESLLRKAQEQ